MKGREGSSFFNDFSMSTGSVVRILVDDVSESDFPLQLKEYYYLLIRHNYKTDTVK